MLCRLAAITDLINFEKKDLLETLALQISNADLVCEFTYASRQILLHTT